MLTVTYTDFWTPEHHCGPSVRLGAHDVQVIDLSFVQGLSLSELNASLVLPCDYPSSEMLNRIRYTHQLSKFLYQCLDTYHKANLVAKTQQKPLELPQPIKIVNQGRPSFLGKLQILEPPPRSQKRQGVVILITSHLMCLF